MISGALSDKMKIQNNKYNQNYRENKQAFIVFGLHHALFL